MRFVNFQINGALATGLMDDQGGLRGFLNTDEQFPGTLDQLIQNGGASALEEAAKALAKAPQVDVEGISYLPPLLSPRKIICVGLNYADHTDESPYDQPDYPTLFTRFASSLVGHNDNMVRPNASDVFDFEGEMVAVIGKGGRHIAKASATDHVLAYSVFNDGSIRDYQFKSPQWTVGKNFDGTGAFGPCLVTADELPKGGSGLKIETRLNGDTVQSSNTSHMIFDLENIISIVSEAITLEAGDVIVSGTPAGIGYAREPKLLMKPGDICEVEVEGIGLLRNQIVQEG